MLTGPDEDQIKDMLDSLIQAAVPDAVAVQKYGGLLYTLKPEEKEGQFCGVFAYKDHVQLSFANGTSLADPDKLLQGKGKYRRHLNFAQANEIDADIVSGFLRQSALT